MIVFSLQISDFQNTMVYSQELVTIKGNLINHSPKSSSPDQQTVFLQIAGGNTGVVKHRSISDSNGYFEFPNIPVVPSDSYSLFTTYMDVEYSMLLHHPLEDEPVILEIFDTTQDIGILHIDSHTLLIREIDRVNLTISATEIILMTNNETMTFKPLMDGPANMNFLRFSLVDKWKALEVQSDLPNAQIINVGSGFGLYGPVKPGFHQIAFSYQFPYDKDNSTVSHSFLQTTSKFRVLMPKGLGLIAGSSYAELGEVDLDGTVYNVWETLESADSKTLTTRLIGLPQPSLWEALLVKSKHTAFTTIWLPIMFATGLIGLLIFAILYKPRNVNSIQPVPSNKVQPLTDRSYELLDEIAKLDTEFDNGAIEEYTYSKQRSTLKKGFARSLGTDKCA